MLIRLSRAYVYTLTPMTLLLIALLAVFHIATLAGSHLEPNGRLFAIWFGINLPILGFAEDRNIWRNEVKQSPAWLRMTFYGSFLYCMVVTLACIFFGDMHAPADFFLSYSAFMLAFTLGSACVLWVTIRSARLNSADLVQRTRRSLLGVGLFSVFYLLSFIFPSRAVRG